MPGFDKLTFVPRFFVLTTFQNRGGDTAGSSSFITMQLRYLLTAAAIAVTACGASSQKTVKVDFQASQARFLETSSSAYMKPLVAEVVVDKTKGRIRDTWEIDAVELSSRTIQGDAQATILNLKSYALFKSAEKHNCDMIIVPTFDYSAPQNLDRLLAEKIITNFANKWRKNNQSRQARSLRQRWH